MRVRIDTDHGYLVFEMDGPLIGRLVETTLDANRREWFEAAMRGDVYAVGPRVHAFPVPANRVDGALSVLDQFEWHPKTNWVPSYPPINPDLRY